jgi:23S rRNA pseudouridine1911/1915/1917 synthase
MAVVAGGRESVTDYEQLATGGGYALLVLHPRTGRTHQIRAHLAYLGLPIAGDLRYGGGEGPGGLRRQFLHAARLGLERPSDGARLRAWSGLPADLAACLAAAGITVPAGRLPDGVGAEVTA